MSGDRVPAWRTGRLLLRCWEPADAPALKAAVDGSLADLQRWMQWARSEPSELPMIEERLARFRAEFLGGSNWAFGIFLPGRSEVLGGAALHDRVGPGALELGYWLRNDCTGRGYATEAAAALTWIGLEPLGAERIEIRCDPDNRASAAIPARLGYRLLRISMEPVPYLPDATSLSMVWSLERGEAARSLAGWPPPYPAPT
jgi:RimJ/RimL family protein N-acetyltransferase